MKTVLSFGAGVQTTAMAILVAQGQIQVDEVAFADTYAEKPETYWYMDNYTKPLFESLDIPFTTVKGDLIEYCKRYKIVPSVVYRWCSDKAKIRPMKKHYDKDTTTLLIGFSIDEAHRANRVNDGLERQFPLIELGIGYNDCEQIIRDYGWPRPLRSSCYFCPFQPWLEWNWLKREHPELIKKCLEMEELLYSRRPSDRYKTGVFGGKPLWRWVEGEQLEWQFPGEYSCYSGDCGH